jgi:hypothetical protein
MDKGRLENDPTLTSTPTPTPSCQPSHSIPALQYTCASLDGNHEHVHATTSDDNGTTTHPSWNGITIPPSTFTSQVPSLHSQSDITANNNTSRSCSMSTSVSSMAGTTMRLPMPMPMVTATSASSKSSSFSPPLSSLIAISPSLPSSNAHGHSNSNGMWFSMYSPLLSSSSIRIMPSNSALAAFSSLSTAPVPLSPRPLRSLPSLQSSSLLSLSLSSIMAGATSNVSLNGQTLAPSSTSTLSSHHVGVSSIPSSFTQTSSPVSDPLFHINDDGDDDDAQISIVDKPKHTLSRYLRH